MPTITCISDTHGKHLGLDLPPADILIHSGDGTTLGEFEECAKWIGWMTYLLEEGRYKDIVFCAGNHDFLAEKNPTLFKSLVVHPNLHYLNQEVKEVQGLSFYGEPRTPYYGGWAFNLSDAESKKAWKKLPMIDVLVTHGPPYGVLDKVWNALEHLGCPHQLKAIDRVRPRLVSFGHIHSGHGSLCIGSTTFVNACSLDEEHKIAYPPIVITI